MTRDATPLACANWLPFISDVGGEVDIGQSVRKRREMTLI
jgi:hypothetical protein